MVRIRLCLIRLCLMQSRADMPVRWCGWSVLFQTSANTHHDLIVACYPDLAFRAMLEVFNR